MSARDLIQHERARTQQGVPDPPQRFGVESIAGERERHVESRSPDRGVAQRLPLRKCLASEAKVLPADVLSPQGGVQSGRGPAERQIHFGKV